MQGTHPRYVIKVVADMDKAVKFCRDVLGLKLKFESPGWSEFVTGETTLALHPASDKIVFLGVLGRNFSPVATDMTSKKIPRLLARLFKRSQRAGGTIFAAHRQETL
jgi:catechol 2,3-dioxygenase-like lactoylglutathione lyase family enzyme